MTQLYGLARPEIWDQVPNAVIAILAAEGPDGLPWGEIADALAEQGIDVGPGPRADDPDQPLLDDLLTALAADGVIGWDDVTHHYSVWAG